MASVVDVIQLAGIIKQYSEDIYIFKDVMADCAVIMNTLSLGLHDASSSKIENESFASILSTLQSTLDMYKITLLKIKEKRIYITYFRHNKYRERLRGYLNTVSSLLPM